MTRLEALLLQVSEEATEVAQAASKCMRFGTEHTWHTQVGTAQSRLYQEFLELMALIEMCQDAGLIQACVDEIDRKAIDAKKERVEKYLLLSRELGCVK
jgi:hypothetical protein